MSLAMYEILRAGGFTTGGFNFDAKLRRQSLDRVDLFHGHVGGIDILARSLLVAADLVEEGLLEQARDRRYEGWDGPLGTAILDGSTGLGDLEKLVNSGEIDPSPVSGQQERLENVINRAIWRNG
jgi:xylose isomerase